MTNHKENLKSQISNPKEKLKTQTTNVKKAATLNIQFLHLSLMVYLGVILGLSIYYLELVVCDLEFIWFL
jgi:hypothetical protein